MTIQLSRREFGIMSGVATGAGLLFINGTIAATFSGMSSAKKRLEVPLGFDNFSVRAFNWKADRLLSFAAEQKLDSILFSDLDVYDNHEATYLESLAKKANDNGILIQAGTGGICPTSSRFDDKWGSAEEHLRLAIQVAKNVGSNVVRCYLGTEQDRHGDGGIQRHIDETVKLLKAMKSFAVDANVKIAVENHAGDMQAAELVSLIEAAGADFVGATLDSGNATWTLEHPQNNLETLGPYALCSGMRDSTVWEIETGVSVAWNAIGEGQVDWKKYVERFSQICPKVPFQLEIISGFNKTFAVNEASFWGVYPDAKAKDFAAFLQLARSGKAVAAGNANDPEFQLGELKRSIQYCKNELGLGLKK